MSNLKLRSFASFQAFAARESALFGGIMQRRVVFLTEVSGQPIRLVLVFLTLEDGTDRLSRNVGKKLVLYAT